MPLESCLEGVSVRRQGAKPDRERERESVYSTYFYNNILLYLILWYFIPIHCWLLQSQPSWIPSGGKYDRKLQRYLVNLGAQGSNSSGGNKHLGSVIGRVGCQLPMQKRILVYSEIAKVEVLSFYRCSFFFRHDFFSLSDGEGPVLFVSLDAEANFWGSAPSWMTSSATFVTLAAVILKRCWWDHYGLTFSILAVSSFLALLQACAFFFSEDVQCFLRL